jgi:hypothetical protein
VASVKCCVIFHGQVNYVEITKVDARAKIGARLSGISGG